MLLQPRPACLARSHAALKFGGWNWRFDLQTGDLTASSTAGRVGYLQLVDISLIKLEQSQEDGAEGAVVNLLKVQTAAVEEVDVRPSLEVNYSVKPTALRLDRLYVNIYLIFMNLIINGEHIKT